jgi:hypothetical protein
MDIPPGPCFTGRERTGRTDVNENLIRRRGRQVDDCLDTALSRAVNWRTGSDCAACPRSTLWFVARPAATWTVREGHALWNGRTLRDWSAPLAADLVDAFHPVEIWLFGSVARGEDGASSDLDVLVVLDAFDPATSIEFKQRAQRAATVPAPFDASFTDVTRMASRRHVAGTLERAVDLEGELLYRRG